MTTHKVGYLIGSLATASINRKLAKALVLLAPPELEQGGQNWTPIPRLMGSILHADSHGKRGMGCHSR